MTKTILFAFLAVAALYGAGVAYLGAIRKIEKGWNNRAALCNFFLFIAACVLSVACVVIATN